MTIRYYIKCETCKEKYTLRIAIGHNERQEHHFLCENCQEDIHVGLDINFETLHIDFECLENCFITQTEGKVVNLQPELTIQKDKVHADEPFLWFDQIQSIFDLSKLSEIKNKGANDFNLIGGKTLYSEEWDILKKCWSLELSGRSDLVEEIINQHFKNIEIKNLNKLKSLLLLFSAKIIMPSSFQKFEDADYLVHEISNRHKDQFTIFMDYYKKNWTNDHNHKFFEIYSEFFDNFSEFNQILIYVKTGNNVPEDCVCTSSAFNQTKMFYGNAFEILAHNVSTIACLNNIHYGRDFDQFEKMNLKKYLDINNANKTNPFKINPVFNDIILSFDSTLRNASHHKAIQFNKNDGNIKYRSGGTGAERTMSYTKYLEECCKIMFSIFILFMLEVKLGATYQT